VNYPNILLCAKLDFLNSNVYPLKLLNPFALQALDLAGDLEVFTLVAEEGSFSAAGRRLNLAPSSIARVLDRIEAPLGVRLLLRTTRFADTDTGRSDLSVFRPTDSCR
jgi:Bacterial regulatory helix-turn-helix protein, lysR family